MAKVSFSKLGLNKEKIQEIVTFIFNDQNIEIKQYLSMHEKMLMINEIINYIATTTPQSFKNPLGLELITNLKIIEYYTNINFTDKQKEDLEKLYDLMESNKLFSAIIEAIPAEEYSLLINLIEESVEAFGSYKSSLVGMLENIKYDYSNAESDLINIQNQIKDPESLSFVHDLLTKLN